jgi:hypothetical protein
VQHVSGLLEQGFEDQQKLFKPPFVHGFEERTYGNAFFRDDMLSGKDILFQGLEQMPAGGMLLQVKIDEGMGLNFKLHLERSVSSGCELWDACQGQSQWEADALVTASSQVSWFERMRRHFCNSFELRDIYEKDRVDPFVDLSKKFNLLRNFFTRRLLAKS